MGHALNGSMQDCLICWHRMRASTRSGSRATTTRASRRRTSVEKQLLAEGTSRQEIGREASRSALGSGSTRRAADHGPVPAARLPRSTTRRERFTMDDGYVDAVMRFFVRLCEKGWIYRANRIINWCPYHRTRSPTSRSTHVEAGTTRCRRSRYPFADGDGLDHDRDRPTGHDPRRRRGRGASGRPALRQLDRAEVVVPVVERRVPVIADERVEREFGTGALQDHAGPRPDRLRDRPRPRPADAERDRARRPYDRRGLRGARPDGGRARIVEW